MTAHTLITRLTITCMRLCDVADFQRRSRSRIGLRDEQLLQEFMSWLTVRILKRGVAPPLAGPATARAVEPGAHVPRDRHMPQRAPGNFALSWRPSAATRQGASQACLRCFSR